MLLFLFTAKKTTQTIATTNTNSDTDNNTMTLSHSHTNTPKTIKVCVDIWMTLFGFLLLITHIVLFSMTVVVVVHSDVVVFNDTFVVNNNDNWRWWRFRFLFGGNDFVPFCGDDVIVRQTMNGQHPEAKAAAVPTVAGHGKDDDDDCIQICFQKPYIRVSWTIYVAFNYYGVFIPYYSENGVLIWHRTYPLGSVPGHIHGWQLPPLRAKPYKRYMSISYIGTTWDQSQD